MHDNTDRQFGRDINHGSDSDHEVGLRGVHFRSNGQGDDDDDDEDDDNMCENGWKISSDDEDDSREGEESDSDSGWY